MKNHHYPFALAICLSLGLSACGSQSAKSVDPSMDLPNKMVPLSTKAGDANLLAGKQSGEDTRPTPTENTDESSNETVRDANAPATFTLAATAQILGELPQADYLAKQLEWVGSEYPACNFFLITALCEAGYCSRQKPFYKAADFDDYFTQENWKQITLEDLRVKSLANETMDVVFQKEGVTVDKPGHVVVLVGYNQTSQRFIVAEGSLGTLTNEVKEVADSFLLSWNGGFRIFIRQPELAAVTGP